MTEKSQDGSPQMAVSAHHSGAGRVTPKGPPCLNCGAPVIATRSNRRYCDDDCKRQFHRRNEIRGGKLMPRLTAWRKSRGKNGGLSEICAMLDDWDKEDRERCKQ